MFPFGVGSPDPARHQMDLLHHEIVHWSRPALNLTVLVNEHQCYESVSGNPSSTRPLLSCRGILRMGYRTSRQSRQCWFGLAALPFAGCIRFPGSFSFRGVSLIRRASDLSRHERLPPRSKRLDDSDRSILFTDCPSACGVKQPHQTKRHPHQLGDESLAQTD